MPVTLTSAHRIASLTADDSGYCHGLTKTPEVRVQRATKADEAEVALFEEAFDNRVLGDETRRFLRDDRHHLVLGYVEDRPAGFVSAVEVFHPDKRGELFLNEIDVVEGERRKGVARALIEELKKIGRELGCVNLWVLTDEDNVPAMRLYRSAGGHWDGSPSVMFEYDLTDGEDAGHATP